MSNAITRADIEPTEATILESIQNDSTGRNKDIVDFIRMLAKTEGPFTYMIGAKWGDGKTFFTKTIEYVIGEFNPHIPQKKKVGHLKINSLPELEGTEINLLPFYFNAMEYDYMEDPIIALFACMATKFKRKGILNKRDISTLITPILNASLPFIPAPVGVKAIASFAIKNAGLVKGKRLISSFEERQEIRTRINKLSDYIAKKYDSKLIVFIDELDRCQPDFAVRLLEQTKNLFKSNNTIIVFAADPNQLSKAIGGAYGTGFDSERFLKRFFDKRFALTPVNGYSFANGESDRRLASEFDLVAYDLSRVYGFSIRDNLRCRSKLDEGRAYCDQCSDLEGSQPHVYIASRTILPALIILWYADKECFDAITSGNAPDALFESAKASKTFLENLDYYFRRRLQREAPDWAGLDIPTIDGYKEYVSDLCTTLFGNLNHEGSFNIIQKTGAFTEYDKAVYRQLVFRRERPTQPIPFAPEAKITEYYHSSRRATSDAS